MNNLIKKFKRIPALKQRILHLATLSTGVSLVETLIAIAVLGMGLTLILGIFRASGDMHNKGNNIIQASHLGQMKMEELVQKGYKGIVTGSKSYNKPLEFYENGKIVNETYRWSAEITKQEQDLVKLNVQVLWPWPENSHHVEFSTLLADK